MNAGSLSNLAGKRRLIITDNSSMIILIITGTNSSVDTFAACERGKHSNLSLLHFKLAIIGELIDPTKGI
jgi:hypothetical protein